MHDTLAGWLAYLESLHPKTIALGLERVEKVRQRLSLDPGFPIITVGGTNGKGSVCAMLESILHAAGYRVGCYTSPHLLRYNERVHISKKQVSDSELCVSFEKIEKARKSDSQSEQEIPLTYFEFGTLAAIQCFIDHSVDVAILEVGLGGRLDAVNIFDCDCAVITSVDIDHTDYLGETREEIAFEKAGIMRSGKIAVCADFNVPKAITDHAVKIEAQLWCIGKDFGFVTHQSQWDYRGKEGVRNALPYPALRGDYQLANASAALAALEGIKESLPVNIEAVRRGLTEVQMAGRFQFIPGRPTMILDVAHNPHAAKSLARSLSGLPVGPNTYAVFSMLKDKDIAGVVAEMDPVVDKWLLAGMDVPRGMTSGELENAVRQCNVRGETLSFASIKEAILYACDAANENDRIVAFGSFYTVAEVMQAKDLHIS